MNRFHQDFYEQFLEWDRLGRGCLPVMPEPVALEPPFVPFSGYHIPKQKTRDDGQCPSFFSHVFDSLRSPSVPIDEAEDDIDYDFDFFERDEFSEIAVSLAPDFKPDLNTFSAFLRQINECAEPVAVELFGTHEKIKFQFCCGKSDADFLIQSLRSYFPEAVFQVSEDQLESALESAQPTCGQVMNFGLAHEFALPLEQSSVDPYIGIAGALSILQEGEFALFQVIFQPANHPWQGSILATALDKESEPHPWIESDFAQHTIEKARQPLYATVARACVAARDPNRLWPLLTSLASPLHQFSNSQGNHLVPLVADEDEYPTAEQWEDVILRQSRRFGMLMTPAELLGFVHIPAAEVRSEKLKRQIIKSKAAPHSVLEQEATSLPLGSNVHYGETKPVFLNREQRVRHTHIVGSSGTGKSNLLFNMIVDDIGNDQGLMLLDPHGDLVNAVLAEVPDHRIDDVIVLDPGDESASVAFNILTAHSDAERNILASDLVAVFERLSTSWGDQMNVILRNAIMAFLESDQLGTLADLRHFLIDDKFRATFLESVSNPDLQYYWQKSFKEYSNKSSVGAVLTRLETFLAPNTIRNVVSQEKSALDFRDIMDSGKILLCKLSQGLIGRENASLFGSLIISKLQQTAMARAQQGEESRREFWCYADEFQNFVTPSMSEILTEARKYRLGLILAHQNIIQLQKQPEVAQTVLSECNVRIVFRVGDQDAKSLSSGFSSFETSDLQSLETGHAIVRVGRSDHDFNVSIPSNNEPIFQPAKFTGKTSSKNRERNIPPQEKRLKLSGERNWDLFLPRNQKSRKKPRMKNPVLNQIRLSILHLSKKAQNHTH